MKEKEAARQVAMVMSGKTQCIQSTQTPLGFAPSQLVTLYTFARALCQFAGRAYEAGKRRRFVAYFEVPVLRPTRCTVFFTIQPTVSCDLWLWLQHALLETAWRRILVAGESLAQLLSAETRALIKRADVENPLRLWHSDDSHHRQSTKTALKSCMMINSF